MTTPAILAVDQGTTNTKALLVSLDGTVTARATRPLAITYPRPGWAEQSADALWGSVVGVIADIVVQSEDCEIVAVGISNQRETVILWDKHTGEPVAPAIIWQCRRSSERCAALRAAGHEAMIIERTGLSLDPLFPSAKIGWLMDHVADGRARAAAGELLVGTVDSWLLWKLTDGTVHATDYSNASRTQIFNLHTLDWDDELLHLFGIPRSLLPDAMNSDSLFGSVAPHITALPGGIPIHAMLGDSHAALLGHGFSEPGEAKVTCGTGSSLMVITPALVRSSHGLSTTIAWSCNEEVRYALEGNISVSGHSAAFATCLLGLPDEMALTALARTVPSSEGVSFVPALAGLGAPHWQDQARGMISGMSLATTPAHIARAALEGIALQICDVFRAIEADLEAALPVISVDGGASQNDFLMQLLADLLDRPVLRPPIAEASAYGVARMAGEVLGLWRPGNEAEAIHRFAPKMDADQRGAVLKSWNAAVRRASQNL